MSATILQMCYLQLVSTSELEVNPPIVERVGELESKRVSEQVSWRVGELKNKSVEMLGEEVTWKVGEELSW